MIRSAMTLLALCGSLIVQGQTSSMKSGFLDPPHEARPQVWWHWLNGNITPDGIRELPLMSKADVADAILDEILRRR